MTPEKAKEIAEYKLPFFVCEKEKLSFDPQIPREDYDDILHRLTMTDLRNAEEEYHGLTNAFVGHSYFKSVIKQFDEVMNEVRVTLEDIGYSVTVKDAFLIKNLCISWKNPFENYHNI